MNLKHSVRLIFLIVIVLSSCVNGTYKGCTDLSASNYNETAKKDDGTCTYNSQVLLRINGISEYGTIIAEAHEHTVIMRISSSFGDIQVYTGQALAGTFKANYNSNEFKMTFHQGMNCALEDSHELSNNSSLDLAIHGSNLQGSLDLIYINGANDIHVSGDFLIEEWNGKFAETTNQLEFMGEHDIKTAIYQPSPECPKHHIYFLTNLEDTMIVHSSQYQSTSPLFRVSFNNHSYPYQNHAIAGTYSVPPSSECTISAVNEISYYPNGLGDTSSKYIANHLIGNPNEMAIYNEYEALFRIQVSSSLSESSSPENGNNELFFTYNGLILNLP